MADTQEAEALRQEVEADFARMEAELEKSSPGVLDVLRVYGDYDAALKQAAEYLAALRPQPIVTTSNTSG